MYLLWCIKSCAKPMLYVIHAFYIMIYMKYIWKILINNQFSPHTLWPIDQKQGIVFHEPFNMSIMIPLLLINIGESLTNELVWGPSIFCTNNNPCSNINGDDVYCDVLILYEPVCEFHWLINICMFLKDICYF